MFRRRPRPRPQAGADPETPPLLGLWFAMRTIAAVSFPLLAIMLAGRFLSALIPAAGLWVQRDLLNALARAIPATRSLAGPAAPAAAHLLALLIVLLGLNALSFALAAAGRAAEGHLREWVGHAVARRHHEVTTGANLEEFERPRFWDRAQRTWNGSVIIESLDGTLDFFANMINLAATIGVLLRVRWEIAPIVLLGALPSLWVGLRNTRENVDFYRSSQPRQRRIAMLAGLLTDAAAALELRLFDIGGFLIGRWRADADAQRREQLRLLRAQQPRSGLATLCRLIAFAVAFYTVALALAHGRAGIGDVTLVVEAIPAVQALIAGILNGAAGLSNSGQYAADTAAFFTTAQVAASRGTIAFPRPIREGIRFEGVSFAYPETVAAALTGLDLFIPAGRTLAVVGRNGAGKTTLIKLLLGIFRPTAGRITVDGIDLVAFDPEDVNRNLAAVFQDFTQFNLTLRENVAFGDLARLHDDAAIAGVIARVGLQAAVADLPQGLDTVLSKQYDDGADLSVGQWQRIAIARALIRPAQVMVLDEPTASLDPLAEVEIFRHFRDLATGRSGGEGPAGTAAPTLPVDGRGARAPTAPAEGKADPGGRALGREPFARTTLLISHRLGVARLAEQIAVISGGRLQELGSHAELLAAGGEYATMFSLQARAYEAAPGR